MPMEIPTTSDVMLIKEFQDVFNKDIRPSAEGELKHMDPSYRKDFYRFRDKLIPSSIVMDTMLYMTKHLAQTACDEMRDAYESGDLDKLNESCHHLDPYWKAAKSLSMAIRAFAQDPSSGDAYLGMPEEFDRICFVCGCEAPAPLSIEDRKSCHGGCPMCEETIEAVFDK